jgi:hypothetical protein
MDSAGHRDKAASVRPVGLFHLGLNPASRGGNHWFAGLGTSTHPMTTGITIHTAKPIALDSIDHRFPAGTRDDNSVNRAFNWRLYDRIPPRDVRLLDIGCAGGGLVKSILDDGGFAVGIEGSDYCQARHRHEWATIPWNLFTADATAPFELLGPGIRPLTFNVITAWEFWEHITEPDIAGVARNLLLHSAPDAFFIGSVSSVSWQAAGIEYHATTRPKPWWIATFTSLGFAHRPDIESFFGPALVRGRPDYYAGFSIALSPQSSS